MSILAEAARVIKLIVTAIGTMLLTGAFYILCEIRKVQRKNNKLTKQNEREEYLFGKNS